MLIYDSLEECNRASFGCLRIFSETAAPSQLQIVRICQFACITVPNGFEVRNENWNLTMMFRNKSHTCPRELSSDLFQFLFFSMVMFFFFTAKCVSISSVRNIQ